MTMQLITEYRPVKHWQAFGGYDVALLLSVLQDYGVDSEMFLSEAGISATPEDQEAGHYRFADKLALFQLAAERIPDQPLGLICGQRASFSDFGLLGFAIASSKNVLEALQVGFKYLQLNGPIFHIQVLRDTHQACIRIENNLEIGKLLPFCSEYFFSAIAQLCAELTGEKLPSVQMLLPYPPPPHALAYQHHFQCPIEFNAQEFAWYFDVEVLQRPLLRHLESKWQKCLSGCESLLHHLQASHRLDRQITQHLYTCLGSEPSAEEIAAWYGLSARTLHRQLQALGTSYQRLKNQVRRDLALELLLNTALSVEEIAYRLGYSDSANFRHSFKRLTGKAPRHFPQDK
ncbi:AraC family transcriptional regulator [Vibrio navarrensis]|uniref:AraC family transcriptional regulator n=1 Tax=Vibrio navarrensis TaxID=29495 RepID=UPI0018DEC05A|nr:AraC family transcriptional regulator [Vibrio navarrensis]MBH9741831.1 AraC family transcriptional regulator [Vibrio navarrensis]